MAFKQIQANGKAITIKKGVVVTGYLTHMKPIKKKFGKEERTNYVYTLTDDEGNRQEVWGNGAINSVCLINGKPNPSVFGFLVRFTGGKKVKLKNKPMPMQEVICEVDSEKRWHSRK